MKIKTGIYILIIVLLSSCKDYTKKDGKVYLRYLNAARFGLQYAEIKKADYESFEVIEHNLNINLAKDKNHVFVSTNIINNADPKTFKQIKKYYWKDKNHVFLLQFRAVDSEIKSADPKTFIVIDDLLWAKDKNYVYYTYEKLHNVIPKNFVAIDKDWGKDNKFYYYHNLKIDSLDYNSAKIVSSYYIKDNKNVLFKNKIVKDANPKTFKADGIGWFGHDDKYMFDWENNKGPITEEYSKTYIKKQ
ncbi:DKNYY domain-containing protein [Flavobacterium flavipallidum]|uniref:DKNYY domain-containing protein n=1 Tax=Flavobacterium flavipallidum TaxID=3139140 RepID=A0ABU9HMH3_9FLAO